MGEGAPLGPLSVTGNGPGRVTEPKNYNGSGPNLGMISSLSLVVYNVIFVPEG